MAEESSGVMKVPITPEEAWKLIEEMFAGDCWQITISKTIGSQDYQAVFGAVDDRLMEYGQGETMEDAIREAAEKVNEPPPFILTRKYRSAEEALEDLIPGFGVDPEGEEAQELCELLDRFKRRLLGSEDY